MAFVGWWFVHTPRAPYEPPVLSWISTVSLPEEPNVGPTLFAWGVGGAVGFYVITQLMLATRFTFRGRRTEVVSL